MNRILVTGANGQIGTDLVEALCALPSKPFLLATDLRPPPHQNGRGGVPFRALDVRDRGALLRLIEEYRIDTVMHLASLLSATGERDVDLAWSVNMDGLKHVLDAARIYGLRVFWPSSIAVFGPRTPRERAPQHTVLDPTTIYGVTKVSGELLCRYYFDRYGVDVRSLRYPGIISYKTPPGGGTTDYAVEIFHAALRDGAYTCFLKPGTRLPMMYMPDAIRATIELMQADPSRLSVRTSYNLGAFSFTAEELSKGIAARVPGFSCAYAPDERQAIADSWPNSIDDRAAKEDWGWQPAFTVPQMIEDMINNLRPTLPSVQK